MDHLTFGLSGLDLRSRATLEQRATAFGYFSGAALFGGAISPTVAGLLAHWNLRGIYYLDAALFVLLTVGLLATGAARAPSPAGEA